MGTENKCFRHKAAALKAALIQKGFLAPVLEGFLHGVLIRDRKDASSKAAPLPAAVVRRRITRTRLFCGARPQRRCLRAGQSGDQPVRNRISHVATDDGYVLRRVYRGYHRRSATPARVVSS
jgi:hypothetical protein